MSGKSKRNFWTNCLKVKGKTEYGTGNTLLDKKSKGGNGVLNVLRNRKNSFFMQKNERKEENIMAFFTTAVTGLKTVVTAIGAGVGVWGVINLLEGYGNDNPGAKSQGIKQLMSGGGIIIVAQTVIPQLSTLFS